MFGGSVKRALTMNGRPLWYAEQGNKSPAARTVEDRVFLSRILWLRCSPTSPRSGTLHEMGHWGPIKLPMGANVRCGGSVQIVLIMNGPPNQTHGRQASEPDARTVNWSHVRVWKSILSMNF